MNRKKGFLAILMAVSLTVSVSLGCLPAMADGLTAPKVGDHFYWGEIAKNSFETAGQQGFYAMYSNSINQGQTFPVDTLKDCVYNASYVAPSDRPGRTQWATPSGDDYKQWFGVYNTGDLGVDRASAAIRWVVPATGTYNLTVKIYGSTDASGDGAIVGIYKGSQFLYAHTFQSGDKYISLDNADAYTSSQKLNKDDVLYVIGDPNSKSANDYVSCDVDIELTSLPADSGSSNTDSKVDETVSYPDTPIASDYFWGTISKNPFNKAGEQGFYAMYGNATNQGSAYPVDSLKDCVLNTDYVAPSDRAGRTQWATPAGADYKKWFGVYNTGDLNGDGNTAAIKWLAPANGKYTVSIEFYGSSPAGNDGAIGGLYQDTKNVFTYNMEAGAKYVGLSSAPIHTFTLTLKKGEPIYVTSDPKKNSANEFLSCYLRITPVGVSGSSADADAGNDAIGEETTDSPDTGSPVVPIQIGIVLVTSGLVALMAYKKR